jgi:hypothetical protein
MAATPAYATSGTGNTTTDGTEQTLFSTASAGYYGAQIDLTNMASGDAIELRIYGKANGSASEALIFYRSFANVQSEPLKVWPPILSVSDFKFTLKRTAGTDRSYQWGIVSV